MNLYVIEFNILYDVIIKKKDFLNRKIWIFIFIIDFGFIIYIQLYNMWGSNESEYKFFLVYKYFFMFIWVKCGNMLCYSVIF